jgi:hypothetical protein
MRAFWQARPARLRVSAGDRARSETHASGSWRGYSGLWRRPQPRTSQGLRRRLGSPGAVGARGISPARPRCRNAATGWLIDRKFSERLP